MSSEFSHDINKFNRMYRLPVNPAPTLILGPGMTVADTINRLKNFKAIISKEVVEVDDIIAKLEAIGSPAEQGTRSDYAHEALTDIADWLGDLQVYSASEMAKFGLPNDRVLSIIMQSNFSKLGADGEPIYDEQGKVQKGPSYYKPEPALSAMIKSIQAGE